ncbi:hypothetical protein [Paenibacillus montanisoli]|uniref:DUF4349 domain-containing protein n=1 Tax=Paenibacillus montanisoli TaxID=2081970 RepID=A0A328UDF9_9BACL|nr:hypothetical protein [Paenibacillus montanisoli]RAP78096.1 hypothetical protein DL346_06550 [Paenibacillus montanisoli]
MSIKRWITCCCVLLMAAGCGSAADNKSPEELLALSVSGLSGVDRYAFSGNTGIGLTEISPIKAMSFQGTVENHSNVQVKANKPNTLASAIHPLEILRQVEASAQKTELLPAESGNRTAVLRITADAKKAKDIWTTRLRNEFSALEKKVPSALVSKSQSKPGGGNGSESALEKEWMEELARSKVQLEKMLSTLQVQSQYRLIIDRKKLLPLKLEEKTKLKYRADGQTRTETRLTKLAFMNLNGGAL